MATKKETTAKKITKEELSALKLVAHGCNSNTTLRGQNEYVEALVRVYALIGRLSE